MDNSFWRWDIDYYTPPVGVVKDVSPFIYLDYCVKKGLRLRNPWKIQTKTYLNQRVVLKTLKRKKKTCIIFLSIFIAQNPIFATTFLYSVFSPNQKPSLQNSLVDGATTVALLYPGTMWKGLLPQVNPQPRGRDCLVQLYVQYCLFF